MTAQENSKQIDATWNAVAEQLGSGWSWTRKRRPDEEPDNWRGWLIGPDDLRFWIHLGNPRWEIGEALDTLVSQSGERCYVRDLYARGERPVTSITVGRGRAAVVIAREIERRLLPSTIESRNRLRARREERYALDARRREAVEAILRRWPATHRCEPHSHEAPRLLIGPDASLDLRIDDRDSITITRWSGLSLEPIS
jgi:hypothetical protein